MGSICIATGGKFCGPSGSSSGDTTTIVGGAAGGGFTQVQPRKPLITVSRVKYHNVGPKRVTVIGIQEN
jgi:hypothetical protein